VVDEDGRPSGSVVGVENHGASDILEISRPDGRPVLVPLVPAAVPEVGDRVMVLRAYLDL
jgi:16S rRNA processing protein RimM